MDDFRCVVGGLSGFDGLEALANAKAKNRLRMVCQGLLRYCMTFWPGLVQVPVRKVTLFDISPMQLLYGELVVELLRLARSRDAFVKLLTGTSSNRCEYKSLKLSTSSIVINKSSPRSLFGRSEKRFGRVLGETLLKLVAKEIAEL